MAKAVKNSATTTKFQSILAASGQGLLDRRAQLVVKRTDSALSSKLRVLSEERDEIEDQILVLTDLSVKTNNSLRPGSDNYDPSEFITKLAQLKASIRDIDEDIAIYEEIEAEYFTAGGTEEV